jgi:hypothetical protein
MDLKRTGFANVDGNHLAVDESLLVFFYEHSNNSESPGLWTLTIVHNSE